MFTGLVLAAILFTGCNIKGTVTDNGSHLKDVTVTLSGSGSKVATTDADGNYEFKNLSGTKYYVTPSLAGHKFSPTSKKVIFSLFKTNDNDVDFQTTEFGSLCSGKITYNDQPLSGVEITVSGDMDMTLTTDPGGEYHFNLENGQYTITPEMGCFSFEPAMIEITVGGTDISGLDFEGAGQMWVGDYQIKTEEDITNLSGYVSVTGNLTIGGDMTNPSTFTNLDGLECLKYVWGYLYIKHNKNLTDLKGINNIASVNSGHINFENNSALRNIDGFNNLSTVGWVLSISDNPLLARIEGFNNASTIKNIVIKNNDMLTKVDGLIKITSVNNFNLEGNKILTTLNGGFGKLTDVDGFLEINNNEALRTLGSLDDLESIQSHLRITSNQSLTDLDLDDLAFIGGDLVIGGNKSLCTDLAEDLKSQVLLRDGIDGAITISGNKDCD